MKSISNGKMSRRKWRKTNSVMPKHNSRTSNNLRNSRTNSNNKLMNRKTTILIWDWQA